MRRMGTGLPLHGFSPPCHIKIQGLFLWFFLSYISSSMHYMGHNFDSGCGDIIGVHHPDISVTSKITLFRQAHADLVYSSQSGTDLKHFNLSQYVLDLILDSLPPMPGQEWKPLTTRAQDSDSQDGPAEADVADTGDDRAQADFCLGQPMFEEEFEQAIEGDIARLEDSLPQVPLPGPAQPVFLGVPCSQSSTPKLAPAAPHAEKDEQRVPVATPCRGSMSNPLSQSQVTMNANVPVSKGSHEDRTGFHFKCNSLGSNI